MFKGLIRSGLLLTLLLLVIAVPGETQPANAIGMQPAQVVTPWSAFPLTAPITSQSYSIAIGTRGVPAITWQVSTPSAPTSLTVNLQASTDGTTYATIDSTTAAGIRTVFGTYKFIQFTVSATSGGTSPTVTVAVVYSLGNAVSTSSGAIYGGGTFTGPLLLPDGTVTVPSIAFASEPTTGFYRIAAGFWGLTLSGAGRIGFYPAIPEIRLNSAGALVWVSNNNVGTGTADLYIYRDAANTLALRNGTAAQTFNIYNTYTDASNYERAQIGWDTNSLYVRTQNAGTGTGRNLVFTSAGGVLYLGANVYPSGAGDTYSLGGGSLTWKDFAVVRSIQGSKSKALTAGVATTVATVAVPQTAGANFAGGEVRYTVYATDATDTQSLTGSAFFSAINKAGTETCTLTDDQIGTEASSSGTLTCTVACATGLTDVVGITFDCASSLTETTLNALVRFDMEQPNTLVFP